MTFYNVPELPGVPPMLRDPSALVPLPYQPAANLIINFATPVAVGTNFNATNSNDTSAWGLFDPATGQAVIRPDTFLGLEYRSSTRISNYPLEEGAFESYNKVNDPFDIVIGMACGGDQTTVAEFLATAKTLSASLDLYTVATPDEIFESVNIERYDYKRSQRSGAWLVTVNFYLKEIRVNGDTEFTNAPETSPTVDQAQTGTTAESSDTARAATSLMPLQCKNPASASQISQGQTNALPATPNQAAPSAGAGRGTQGVPVTSPALSVLPSGYTQAADTNVITAPNGKPDPVMTITQGTSYIGPGG